MVVSDVSLRELLADGELAVMPLEENQIQPASIDLRLGSHFLALVTPPTGVLSLDEESVYKSIESREYVIPPLSFLLATTMETVRLPAHITAFVEGRSSIGRLGLFIQNAGWVDPGFEGQITLELYNATQMPIRLTAGRRICQLVFAFMDRPTQHPYRGKYQGQQHAVGSRIHWDVQRQKGEI